jgi:cobalt-zinc-cadmium efflux system outer membrane protein
MSSHDRARPVRLVHLIALCALACANAAAQEQPALTVQTLVERAWAGAREHGSAARRQAATADASRSRTWRNPELELSAGQGHTRNGDGDDEFTAGVSLKQPMEWPGARRARADASGAGILVAEAQASALRLDLEAEVRTALSTHAHRGRSLRHAQDALVEIRRILEIVQRRVDAGESNRADLVRAKLQEAHGSQTVDERIARQAAALADLGMLCGPVSEDAAIAPENLSVPDSPALAVERALQHHPRLALGDAQILARDAQRRSEASARLPTFDVGGYWERSVDTEDVGATIGLDIPLWDRNAAGISAAEAETRLAQSELALARSDITRAVSAAWYEYDLARKQVERSRDTLHPAAHENYQLVRLAYTNGEASILELLDAWVQDHEIEEASLQAEFDTDRHRVRLLHAMGAFTPGATQ